MQMEDIDHTHPHTDESFGAAFRRGARVAADGGERSTGTAETTDDQMADVPHQPPNEGAHRTFERGMEGRDETV